MKISLFGNRYQEKYKTPLRDFVGYLQEAHSLSVEADFAAYLTSLGFDLSDSRTFSLDDFEGDELAVSIGGDGTLLSKASRLASHNTPVVGINTGHLGYLAACRLNEAREMIENIARGECRHEQRTMLQLVSINGKACDNIIALNEIAILRQDTTSMISMPTTINGTMLTTYMGDGLVISTPTGSTAYNMSVGGPIIMPMTSCLALSPISPHSLTMRPIVVGDDSEIEVTINTRAQWIQVSVDGMAMTLPSGSTVKIGHAPYKLSVIQKKDHNFANTLREKLLWGADQR
ncbi:MAG: NAD(+)/NADH kinase [Muribaculaceae bacterium]|nr:NAD(+)/NADH kinase [Muribaculaceae bacterium]MBQ3910180.1 NAD(+)/NADH kinase [Muribaculaceae bacterium]MBQ6647682.1 NAD(+)/NADH kinase [Muribaculaceae bacterium]